MHMLYVDLGAARISKVFDALVISSPSLGSLELTGQCPPVAVSRILLYICELRSLQQLTCLYIIYREQALSALGSLPSLRSVPLSIDVSNSSTLRLTPNALRNLKHIAVYSPSIVACTHLLRCITSPSLERIHLAVETVPAPADLEYLWSSLGAFASSLTTLVIDQVMMEVTSISSFIVPPAPLRSLIPLRRLTSLSIRTFSSFERLDDALLRDMAAAWPLLQELTLGPLRKAPRTRVTLGGLVPLAALCPNLRKLGLPFDASVEELRPTRRPGGGVVNESLRHFAVGESRFSHVPAVAAFLSDTFPNWRQVTEFIRSIAAVRRQERASRADGVVDASSSLLQI
ncbi:hypothetical protein PLICRDRAFT_540982 [Plicaturopsis crispa FD-325 SS-3]|nr:hypothetical protein PLICRDRAFT_540982 [Plicaturopsis crispa FD-325 SS-3]